MPDLHPIHSNRQPLPIRASYTNPPRQWAALESHTAPPYTLTLKSNGCIIFIAALTPTKLLVTSKHSVGPTPGASGAESHAQVGERWLRKHLAAGNKTEAQLAQTLWDQNWTAVAEVRLLVFPSPRILTNPSPPRVRRR